VARWLTLRFHCPLIEPDGRFSRIRLSDKNSHLRPRKASRSITKADEAEFIMQSRVGEPCRPSTPHLMLPSKLLPEPMPRVAVNGSIGRADWSKTKVVRPTQKLPVQLRHPVLDRRPQPAAAERGFFRALKELQQAERETKAGSDGQAARPTPEMLGSSLPGESIASILASLPGESARIAPPAAPVPPKRVASARIPGGMGSSYVPISIGRPG